MIFDFLKGILHKKYKVGIAENTNHLNNFENSCDQFNLARGKFLNLVYFASRKANLSGLPDHRVSSVRIGEFIVRISPNALCSEVELKDFLLQIGAFCHYLVHHEWMQAKSTGQELEENLSFTLEYREPKNEATSQQDVTEAMIILCTIERVAKPEQRAKRRSSDGAVVAQRYAEESQVLQYTVRALQRKRQHQYIKFLKKKGVAMLDSQKVELFSDQVNIESYRYGFTTKWQKHEAPNWTRMSDYLETLDLV